MDLFQLRHDLNSTARVCSDALGRALQVAGNVDRLKAPSDVESCDGELGIAEAAIVKMRELLAPQWEVQVTDPKKDKPNPTPKKKKDEALAPLPSEAQSWKP